MSFRVFLLLVVGEILATDVNEEILAVGCDCRDWNGGCRKEGDRWLDDDTWNYECGKGNKGQDASFTGCSSATPSGEKILVGQNKSVGGLWHSCEINQLRIKYEIEPHCLVNGSVRRLGEEFREGRFQWLCLETGRWEGCYYSNETHPDVYLKIGETGYNGLIKHVCDRFIDYPGRVQYYAEVRDDVHVKHPTNKGINKNFQPPADLRIKEKVDRWEHESASLFIADAETFTRTKIRFLPSSRQPW